MLILTDEKLSQFGIVTRASKGAELTFEEMDRNVVTALDVMKFDRLSCDGMDEYPAIINAQMAVEGENTVSPINGYCALRIPPELDGMDVNFGVYGWIYASDFSTYTDGRGVVQALPDGILVFSSDADSTVTISTGGASEGGASEG